MKCKNSCFLDEVHRLIEHKHYRFILTGSSARRLKQSVNLFAGRAIRYTMHPLTVQELGDTFSVGARLGFGMLPATYTYDDPCRVFKYLCRHVFT